MQGKPILRTLERVQSGLKRLAETDRTIAMTSLGGGGPENGSVDVGELIGVISSWNLSRAGETGYGLVFTAGRVIGARRSESEPDFAVYLGAGGAATEAERASSVAVASHLLRGKQFVLDRDEIAQILYRRPGFLTGGFVIFKTSLEAFKVEVALSSGWNEGPSGVSKVLIECLMSFAPGRVYDGRSGNLYAVELLREGHDQSDS